MCIIRQEFCRLFSARPRSQANHGTTLVARKQALDLLGFVGIQLGGCDLNEIEPRPKLNK